MLTGGLGILRVTEDGKKVGEGILGITYPLNLYYAYGLRNSFGLTLILLLSIFCTIPVISKKYWN